MAGDKDSRRRTIGYVFTMGGTTVSWISKPQQVVALSTTKVEYVVVIEASREIIWLQRFMEELGKKQNNRGYTVAARVPFILQRTQHFIRRVNIYNSSTTS